MKKTKEQLRDLNRIRAQLDSLEFRYADILPISFQEREDASKRVKTLSKEKDN